MYSLDHDAIIDFFLLVRSFAKYLFSPGLLFVDSLVHGPDALHLASYDGMYYTAYPCFHG
jgi:hypothetical protein